MAGGPKLLTFIANWDHAMPQKFHDECVYVWLDMHLKRKPGFMQVTPVVVNNEQGRLIARWEFDGAAASADLIASYGDDGNWTRRFWHTLKAEISGRTCTAELLASLLACYVSGSATDKNGSAHRLRCCESTSTNWA